MAGPAKDERVSEHMLVRSLAAEFSLKDADIKILDWSTKTGGADADNFCTDMVAVKGTADLSGKAHSFSYMAKVLPKGKFRSEMVKKVWKYIENGELTF